MKKHILFFFFAFQVSTYAQESMNSKVNFEKQITSLGIYNDNPNEKTQLIDSSCYSDSFTISNESDNLALNPESKNQLKSLNISKRINLDYLVFSYNQKTVADIGNDYMNLY